MHKTTLLLLLLASPTATQSVSQPNAPDIAGIRRLPTGGTPVYSHLDLDTGVLTTGGLAVTIPTLCFDNTFDEEWADALLFFQGDELFDWGIKGCGGSTLVNRIRIGYASQADQVHLGGPGGSLDLQIYAGSLGHGDPGQELLSLQLRGLPSEGPFMGGLLIPQVVTIDLGAQAFFLPDGAIGWGYRNADGLSAPLLVDVGVGNGTENAIDLYRGGPAGPATYVTTFTLPPGGVSNDPLENSFFLQLFQDETPATVQTIAVAGNPDVFTADGAVVGSPWYPRLATYDFPNVTSTFVILSYASANLPIRWGTLLVDPTQFVEPISIRPGGVHRFDIPLDANYVGLTFFAQGGLIGSASGVQLTNGIEATIGAF